MVPKGKVKADLDAVRTPDARKAPALLPILLTVLLSVLAPDHTALAVRGDYAGEPSTKTYTGVPQSQGPVRQDSDLNRPSSAPPSDVHSVEKAPPGVVPGRKISPFSVSRLECTVQNDYAKKKALLMVRHTSIAPIPAGFEIEWKCTRVEQFKATSGAIVPDKTSSYQGAYLLSAPLPRGKWLEIEKLPVIFTGTSSGILSTYYKDCRSSAKPPVER